MTADTDQELRQRRKADQMDPLGTKTVDGEDQCDALEDDDKSDWPSILLLLLLYTLQGIPMGLSSSIPFLLQEKVNYADQATFSFVSWPFSLKLLWAPFVDSMYSTRFGRRKSWLVPVQFVCAALMIGGSLFIGDLLGEGDPTAKPHVNYLTVFFFILYFMMATQDIAVDGWALTMLSPKSVGHASTCNTVGQTIGFFVAYVGFLALHDPATCNAYFRLEPNENEGIVTLPGFMNFWGWVMAITTVGVWLLKKEEPEKHPEQLSIVETYKQLGSVMSLSSVMELSAMQLTSRMGFAAAESVASLKLVEYGFKKEQMALLTPILIPFGIAIPIYLGSRIKPDRPLDLYLLGYPFRLMMGILYALIVYWTPGMMSSDDETWHMYFFLFIAFSGALHEVTTNMMYVPQMAFYARISDPAIGGTYMTFLNTVTNLGAKWPASLSLALVDYLTTRECVGGKTHEEVLSIGSHTCSDLEERELCASAGGECIIIQDGFYVEVAVCTVIGVLWLLFYYRRIHRLQDLALDQWRVVKTD